MSFPDGEFHLCDATDAQKEDIRDGELDNEGQYSLSEAVISNIHRVVESYGFQSPSKTLDVIVKSKLYTKTYEHLIVTGCSSYEGSSIDLDDTNLVEEMIRNALLDFQSLYPQEYVNLTRLSDGDLVYKLGERQYNLGSMIDTVPGHRGEVLSVTTPIAFDQSEDSKEYNEKDLPLGEYLTLNGIPQTTENILVRFLLDNGVSEINVPVIVTNFVAFQKVILAVESRGGENIINEQGSSAKGPYQIIDGYIEGQPTMTRKRDEEGNIILNENGNEIMVRAFDQDEGDFSPFDRMLRNSMRYYSGSAEYYNYDQFEDVIPGHVIEFYEGQPALSPFDLTYEQSINLVLVDMFYNPKFNAELLTSVLLHGNLEAVTDLYNELHHTNPNDTTRLVFATALLKHQSEFITS